MKKLFTFLFLVGAVTTSFAQYDQRSETRRDDQYAWKNANNNDRRFNDYYSFTAREKDEQIERINREFDYKVSSIRNNFFMRRREKREMIEQSAAQRDQQIRIVFARFNNNRNQCSADFKRDYDNRRNKDWR